MSKQLQGEHPNVCWHRHTTTDTPACKRGGVRRPVITSVKGKGFSWCFCRECCYLSAQGLFPPSLLQAYSPAPSPASPGDGFTAQRDIPDCGRVLLGFSSWMLCPSLPSPLPHHSTEEQSREML